jgi:[protein-PII] uridylyltransferase
MARDPLATDGERACATQLSSQASDLSPQPSTLSPAVLRSRLADLDAALAARFDGGEDIDRLLRARAAALDALLREAWMQCMGDGPTPALFAVGGYGRGELFPQSDIDLLVLAEPDAQARHAEALSRFFALLWDGGLPIGHAVRSLEQTAQAAREDITVLTAQLEARLLQGDPAHVARLATAIAPDRLWPAREYFGAKREEQRLRHARFGDTSDNLEPNLKDGPGGLRDLQTLRWMTMRVAGVPDMEALVSMGQLGADEGATLERERRALSRLRFGLHLVAGKREERLRFDHQKALAARLGHSDDADTLAVEQMMQGFYRSAALVQRIGERVLQRFEEQLAGEATIAPIDEDFELRSGYLAARDPAWPAPDHAAMEPARSLRGDGNGPGSSRESTRPAIDAVFSLFAAWAADSAIRGLHSQTARQLAEALPRLPPYERATPAQRARFMALLRGPQPVRTLERMARLGVLGRWLPAFARVSGRMQFDLFHVYTVDQHTLAVLRNVAGFASGQADERFAIAHDVWPRLHKPELLLLAALFHDIAKGRGGDHSELGAVDARAFCAAHALPEADIELVAWLVERHLLMSTTAQKQDIADPEVIHRFADRVADRDRLDYLYLLTCADIAGTSPKLWNAWKDRLLGDLYAATRQAFRRGLEHPVAPGERLDATRAAARALLVDQGFDDDETGALFARMPQVAFLRGRADQLAWQAGALRGVPQGATRVAARRIGGAASHALEVFVHSPDRDGLFAAIVATLDRLGLAIQRARVLDGPGGTIFDTFEVLPSDPTRPAIAAEVERKLHAVLAAPLDGVRPARRTQPRHLKHFRIVPQVGFDAAADGARTALSIVCTDRPGLLADIAQVLRAQRLRVHDARIATFGERAEDVFQITDERDRALDPERQQALRVALLDSLEGDRSA